MSQGYYFKINLNVLKSFMKAQTLAQMNAKLEAEILNVREDLFSQIAEMKSSKDENEKLILEFHKEKVN